MRLIGNILWHIPFLGFVSAFLSFLIGTLLTLLVVTAPIGLGLLQLAKFQMAPFSYAMVSKGDLNLPQNPLWRTYSFLVMLLYLPVGCVMAIITICQVVGLCMNIVGIPAAMAVAKTIGTYLNPVNKVCVPVGMEDAARRQKAHAELLRRQGRA